MNNNSYRFFLVGIACFSLFFFSCSRKDDYNVLLLTLDTTRADHLRCYGYQNVETPALNSLFREGILFARAYAPNPMTLPAHTTILSGTLPLYHGVLDNGGFTVPEKLVLLSEVLKENGYTTAGFVSAAVLKKNFGLSRGFDYWNEEDIKPQPQMHALVAERKANLTTDAVLKWLDENKNKRFFIWVHYYDPHKEYDPPEPYRQLYYFDPYSGEIAFMDSQIKRLFDYLKQKKLYDKTIIIAIGDHGESLGEHGEPTHWIFLYEATQRVPFLVRIPGLKNPGRIIMNVVSQIDLMPTVLDLLSIKIPAQVQGRSLKRLIYEKEPNEPKGEAFLQSHFSYLHFGWSELYGLVTDRYKYIQAPTPELYDLSWDHNETKNIAKTNEKLIKEFDYKIEQTKKNSRSEISADAKKSANLDSITRAQLLSLGYLPAKSSISPEKAVKDDPKDFTDLFPVIMDSMIDLVQNNYQGLLQKAEKILIRDPDNLLALRLKATALFGLGEYRKDIDWIKHSISITGESSDLYYKMGLCYLRLQKYDDARIEFEKGIKLDPNDEVMRYYLARIYLAQGKPEDALKQIEEVKMREKPLGHLLMAIYYLTQEREGRAKAEFELAMEKAPDMTLVKLEYALFLLKNGEAKMALDLFESAERIDPSIKFDSKIQEVKQLAKKMLKK